MSKKIIIEVTERQAAFLLWMFARGMNMAGYHLGKCGSIEDQLSAHVTPPAVYPRQQAYPSTYCKLSADNDDNIVEWLNGFEHE